MSAFIQKYVPVGDGWVRKKFYSLPDNPELRNFLKDKYGKPVYTITWWPTFNGIYLAEEIYVHWKLCE